MRVLIPALFLSIVLSLIPAGASASPPAISFETGDPSLHGDAGTSVAWLGMVRTWEGGVGRLRYLRGSGKIPAEGLKLGRGINTTSSVWLVAGVGDSFRSLRTAPGMRISADPLEVTALAGATEIAIRAGFVHGTYVKADGRTWAFSAGDGGSMDAGGEADGSIRLALGTLDRRAGNPAAPEAVEAGDKILLIEPDGTRAAIIEVAP